jgi:hypothetical protein
LAKNTDGTSDKKLTELRKRLYKITVDGKNSLTSSFYIKTNIARLLQKQLHHKSSVILDNHQAY